MSNDAKWSVPCPRHAGQPLQRAGLIGAFAAALIAANACDTPKPPAEQDAPEHLYLSRAPDRAPGEYIVTVRPGTRAEWLRQQYAAYGVREIVDLGGNMFLVKLSRDPGPEEFGRKGAESGKIKAVQPNFIYRGTP